MSLMSVIGLMGGYDPDAILYFNQLTVQPSAAYKNAVNTLVLRLKSDSNWTPLDRFWIHATELQQHARVSLSNPTSTQLTEVNTPSWVASQGYTGNGTTQYINTNYNPATNGVRYTLNSASIGVYLRTNVAEAKADMGCWDTGAVNTVRLYSRLGTNIYQAGINTGGVTTIANTDSRGLFVVDRLAGTVNLRRNGTNLLATGLASSVIPSRNIYLLGLNDNNAPGFLSTKQCAISFIGSGAINQTTFYTAIQAFATTLGFNV